MIFHQDRQIIPERLMDFGHSAMRRLYRCFVMLDFGVDQSLWTRQDVGQEFLVVGRQRI
jgi:hypothetical protein